MANGSVMFSINEHELTYLGTWRFGVDSPRYERMVLLSIVLNESDKNQLAETAKQQSAAMEVHSMVTTFPSPAESKARLYEVMSYPRVPPYFQNHQW